MISQEIVTLDSIIAALPIGDLKTKNIRQGKKPISDYLTSKTDKPITALLQ